MNNTQLTGADLLNRYPKGVRMIQIRYKELSGQPFKKESLVAPDILAQLDEKWLREKTATPAKIARKSYAKSTGGETAQSVVFARNVAPDCAKEPAQIAQVIAPIIAPQIAPVEIAPPAQEVTSEGEISRNWRGVFHYIANNWKRIISDCLCIGIVLFHASLITYDCATQWGTFGLIGGLIALGVVCLALLYSADDTMVRTSGFAVMLVAVIDFAAWFVHSPTAQAAAKAAGKGVTPFVTDVFSGALCLFSFTALYMYRDSKII